MRLYTATSRKKPSSLHHLGQSLGQYASPNIMFVTFGHRPGERADSGGRASPAAARARTAARTRPLNEPARPCSPAARTRTAAQAHKPEPPRAEANVRPRPPRRSAPRTAHPPAIGHKKGAARMRLCKSRPLQRRPRAAPIPRRTCTYAEAASSRRTSVYVGIDVSPPRARTDRDEAMELWRRFSLSERPWYTP